MYFTREKIGIDDSFYVTKCLQQIGIHNLLQMSHRVFLKEMKAREKNYKRGKEQREGVQRSVRTKEKRVYKCH